MMFHVDFRIAEIRERERRLAIEAERHRLLHHATRGPRLRLGGLLMRLGRVIGGEAVGAPSISTHATNAPLC